MTPSQSRGLPALSLLLLALVACNAERAPATEVAADASADSAPSDTAAPPAQPAQPVPAPTPPAPAPAGLARFDGYGDVRFGMDVDAGRQAWGSELNGAPLPGSGCYYLNPVSNPSPSYFAFMIDDGKFVRYDVGNDTEVAPGGGKRGMSADDIRRLYPDRVEERPHKYTDGQYLRIKDAGGSGVLVFETDAAGKVSEWHVGVPPQVDYVEGCS